MNPLFPYAGGKRRAAPVVWEALGEVAAYIEPFAGSLAVLLHREQPCGTEIVNDADGLIANLWRALADDPEAVMAAADRPPVEVDLWAIHHTLVSRRDELVARLQADPGYYDERLAGWWWWGASTWFGSGWGSTGRGQRPHIDRSLKGVHSQWFRADDLGERLLARLRGTIVLCGDWSRSVTPAILRRFSTTGIFLDPPYRLATGRAPRLYGVDGEVDGDVCDQVEAWCLDQTDESVRIVLAGYRSDYPTLIEAGWTCVEWAAPNGMATASDRRRDDVLLLSPSCVGSQSSLFTREASR